MMALVFTFPNRYVSPEQVPVQYGGLSVDYCDCNPDFTIADPVTELIVKPATKQNVEIIISEVQLLPLLSFLFEMDIRMHIILHYPYPMHG